ncbi:response regulator [Gracilimonas sp. Q87]|uniref:hybrid sensor histidine kinase/response regulator n=1 Tax=Gracilimonas sp. Q87 TaxID=3384766 RepID=UPI0039844476
MSDTKDNLILIVDDTLLNLRLLSHVLENGGYKHIKAQNGKEAIELAESKKPDLILMDIMMPGMDGFEAVHKIKSKNGLEDIPVIFLSALTETDDKIQAFEYGGVDYITKPFQKEETLARIDTHLKIRNLQKQLNDRIDVLKDREVELSRLNKKKDDLVRMVSHDIKNPLTGIIGLVKLMRDTDDITPEERKHMLSVIENSGNDLLNMVHEVLDRESKKDVPESLDLVDIEIVKLIERVISMNKAKSMLKDIELVHNVEPDGLRATLDQNKIEIAINNLVSNALKFTPSRGTVSLSVNQNKAKNTILIEVKDSGIGIPESMRDDLFENEIKNSRKGTGGEAGTGLGLDIVHLYVSLHNGNIRLESEENVGTSFFVELPVKPSPE